MLRFGKTKVAKEEFYGTEKKKSVNIVNLIETKNYSKYLFGCLDEVIKPLVLIVPKISGYVETSKKGNKK